MKLKELIEANKDGFTLNLSDDKLVDFDNGYQVAITNYLIEPEELDDKAFLKCMNFLQKMQTNNSLFIGGWYDETARQYALDVSYHVDSLEQAEVLASIFKQKSIYNWSNKTCIYILT